MDNTPIPVQAPADQPNNQVVASVETVAQDLGGLNKVETEVKAAFKSVGQHYKSPAFWLHLVVQAFAILSYVQASDPSLRFGSLALSGSAFVAYVLHLIKA